MNSHLQRLVVVNPMNIGFFQTKRLLITMVAMIMASFLLTPSHLSAQQWDQLGMDIPGETASDESGRSVSLSSDGSRIVIGAPLNDGTGIDAGHARVYEYASGSWTQLGVDIEGEAAGDQSGFSVSISSDGNRVAIGAPLNSSDAGHTRVFEFDGTNWIQIGADIDGEATNDQSGYSISLSSDGNRVAIGAPFNDGTAMDAGHTRIYEFDGVNWVQLGADIDGEAANDQSGWAVSLSSDGSRVAIGAPQNDGNGAEAGHTRIYEFDGANWMQLGSDIEGEAANDESGWSVSLSSDGSRVAIGARGNDDSGTDAGHTRIYEYDGSSWMQLGSDIDGESADDQSGYSVALSSDGNQVAIGAPLNDGNGINSGQARIFNFISPCPDDPAFANCPTDTITVGNDFSNCSGGVNWSIPVTEYSCNTDSVVQVSGPAPGQILPVGVYNIVYVAYGPVMNNDTCEFVVEVIDTQSPIVGCPADLTVAADQDSCNWTSAPGSLSPAVAIENCGPELNYTVVNPDSSIISDSGDVSGYTFELGTSEVIYVLTDSSGIMSDTCSFRVTVEDEQDPQIICPGDTILFAPVDSCGLTVIYDSIQVSDNCPITISNNISQNAITTLFAWNVASAGNMFDIENVGSAPITIDSFYISLTTVTRNVLVYYIPGTYIGSESNGAAWTFLGSETITGNGFNNPTLLNVGGLIVNPGESYGIFIIAPDGFNIGYTSGSNIYNNGSLELRAGIAKSLASYANPFSGVVINNRIWNGTVHYTESSPSNQLVQTDNSGLTSGSFFSVGTTVQEYTVTDESGNTASCSFTVTVLDTVSPIIVCPSDTIISANAGECEGQYEWEHPDPFDNCRVETYSVRYINPDGTTDGPFNLSLQRDGFQDSSGVRDFELGTTTVEYYVVDPSGNSDTCSFTVTVTDDESPSFVNCPADTITVGNDFNNCAGGVNWSVPIAEDNCNVESVTQTAGPAPGQILSVGVYDIQYVASDAAGNTDTCDFVVEVLDTQTPIVGCPADITVSADLDSCSWTSDPGSLSPAVAIENCEPALTYSVLNPDGSTTSDSGDVSGYTFDLGTSEVTYVLTDSSGMMSDTCSFRVTVEDEQDPEVICPGDTVLVNDAGLCGAIYEYNLTIEDNCPIVGSANNADTFNFTGSVQTFVVPLGVTEVSISAFGAQGGNGDGGVMGALGGYASGVLSVSPGDVLNIYVGGQGATVNTDMISGGGYNGGGNARGMGGGRPATRGAGGGASDIRINGITLNDRVIVAAGGGGSSFPGALGGAGGGLIGQSGSSSAGGNGGNQMSGGSAAAGTNGAEAGTFGMGGSSESCCVWAGGGGGWYGGAAGSGGGGGSSYLLGVNDSSTTSATRIGDGMIIISYDAPVQQISGLPSGSLFPVGTTTNTFVVTDGSGNTSSCSFTVTVEDVEAPIIDCPADTSIVSSDGGTGNCEGLYEWNHPIPTDNCGVEQYQISYINPDGSIEGPFVLDLILSDVIDSAAAHQFSIGTTVVNYFVVDGSGNTDSCSFTVTVTDDEDPSFVNCPATNITTSTDANECSANVSWSIPVAEDNCDVDSVTQIAGLAPGSSFPVGTDTITYVAYDAAGNTDTCTFTVTVEDTEEPNAVCQDETIYLDGMGMASITIADIDGGSSDNCGVDTITASQLAFTCADRGDNNVTLVVTDIYGNLDSCVATVTVVDSTFPVLICPDSMAVSCDGAGNIAELNAWLATATATDNCDPITVQNTLFNTISGCGGTSTQVYEFTATDSAGNTTVCYSEFVIIDTTAPTITMEAQDITVQCDGGSNNASQLLDWLNNNGGATAFDTCSNVTWSNNYGTFTPDTCDGTSGVDVTFYATDECGNVDSTTANLMIVDTVAPVWSIDPVDITLECSDTIDPYNEIAQWLAAAGYGDAQDSCSIVIFTNDYDTLTGGCGMGSLTGSATVTFTATDACGNFTTRVATVEVVDMTEPRITRPAIDTTVECDGAGNMAELQTWLDNNGGARSEDVCGPVTWNDPVLLQTIEGCGFTVEYVYSFSSVDACGNQSDETVARFIIEDTTPPTVDPMAMDTVVECNGSGNTEDLNRWLNNLASAGATDACGEVSWEWDLITETDLCGITGVQTYRFTVTDECGNETITDGTFTIQDTEAPVITGGEDYTGECDQSNANNDDELLSWLNNNGGATADDVCGNFTWSNNYDINNWVEGCNDSRNIDVDFVATDECGNSDTITLNFSTGDNEPPIFTNCPRPPIVVDAPQGWCSAYVNFSFPYATDNCGVPIVEQTDTTGLSTGDLFPVGLTILEFTATDSCGNSTVCTFKVVVNDYHTPPVIECPNDTMVLNDPGECGAIVSDIEPETADNCPFNTSVVYNVYDEEDEFIYSGLEDASGNFFPVGNNRVEYIVYDQPIFLITEVIQDGDESGVEIGNFGPADMDLSCATLRRITADTTVEFMIPEGVVLEPGEVYTNVFDLNIPAGTEAAYEFAFLDRIIDAVTINDGNLDGDNIIRIEEVDTDDPSDFMVVNPCTLGSFGEWNPQLDFFTANGSMTSLQAEDPSSDTCNFTLEVLDVEAPQCVMHDSLSYFGNGQLIRNGTCVTSTVEVAEGIVGDVNIHDLLIDIDNAGALNVSLISPSGTEVLLFEDLCENQQDVNVSLDDQAPSGIETASCNPLGNGLSYIPMEELKAFYGEQAEGTWTLEIYLDENIDGTLTSWNLEVLLIEAYDQPDITIANDSSLCGADVTWTHPVFDDNCCEGTMTVTYDFSNATTGESYTMTNVILDESVPVDMDGVEVTRFFDVGVTEVTYTLTDLYGNTSTCGFTVTVNDEEAPVFPNGCFDMAESLDPGECYGDIGVLPDVQDNCEIDTVVLVYEDDGSFVDPKFVPIGSHDIFIIATDIYGNADTCEFNFEVTEFIPNSSTLTCNDHVNLSLDENCQAVLGADMILEGGPYRCYENYALQIEDAQGNPHLNFFDLSDVGQTFTVSVVDILGGGNSCWGTVTIELKLPPRIECPADTTLRCNVDLDDLDVTGRVNILSCAPTASISYEDQVVNQTVCGDTVQVLDRTFTVTTNSGASVSCTQRIVLLGFDFDHVDFPENITFEDPLACAEVAADPSLTEPENTGWPQIDGKDIIGNTGECQLNVGYWDEILTDADCPSGYEILRNWVIRDECQPLMPGVNPLRHIQAIKVEDNLPPALFDIADVTIGTDAFNCNALTYTLPEVVDFDNCSEYSIEWRVQYGYINNGQIIGLQPGANTVTAIVTDSCDNRAQTSFVVNVIDDIPPVAICDQNTKVALGSDGYARVQASTINDGSYDNCGIDRIQIRRVEYGQCDSALSFDDRIWKDYEEFCCADIANSPIMIEMGVWDVEGNFNSCMVEVNIEDKERPVISQPQNLTLSCTYDFDIWYLEDPSNRTFGGIADFTKGEVQQTTEIYDRSLEVECKQVISGRDYDAAPYPSYEVLDGYVDDNCIIDTIEIRIRDERNNCGVGNIVREFIVRDIYGNQTPVDPNNPFTKIEQVITFEDCDPFEESDIIWPRQYDGLTPSTPILTCEDLANDSTSADPTPQGTGVPRFRGNADDECASIAVRYEDEIFDVVPDACYKIFRHWEVIDWCTFDSDPAQPWTYTQVIKVKDEEAPILSSCVDITICDTSAIDCNGAVTLTQTVDDCTPDEFLHATLRIEPFNDDNNPADDIVIDDLTVENGQINWDGSLPFGTHRVTWLVEDMCGQVGTCEYLLTVADCKLPTPYCLNGVATVVMPSVGMIEIWASDFDAGSFDNCGDIAHFSFSSDTTEKGKVFTCDSLENGEATTFEVEIWVTDQAGNQDFCRTYVIIQDNNDVCPDSNATIISGTIETNQNRGVEDVEVRLQNMNAPTPMVRVTDANGGFLFGAQNGVDYELSANKNDDILNGVSTWDISLIQQHILGLNTIEDPYLLIAANIDDDRRVSGSDLIELRKVILGLEPEFPNNESWRFVDATQSLPMGVLPRGYAEVMDLMNVQTNMPNQDFVGVKIGDIDGSVEPNQLTSGTVQSRSNALILTAEDAVAEKGEELRLEVTSEMFREVMGYQWTMNHASSMEFVTAESGAIEITENNIGVFADRGQLTMSWNEVEAQNVKAGEVLFTLVFKATEDVRLSEAVNISSEITRAEAYVDGDITQVDLRFTQASADFALYQNTPNPFESKTIIGFNLPEANEAVLTVYDVTGKVLRVIEGQYAKGYNQVSLDRNELSASGVVYYQLESGDYSATKKMVIIE